MELFTSNIPHAARRYKLALASRMWVSKSCMEMMMFYHELQRIARQYIDLFFSNATYASRWRSSHDVSKKFTQVG